MKLQNKVGWKWAGLPALALGLALGAAQQAEAALIKVDNNTADNSDESGGLGSDWNTIAAPGSGLAVTDTGGNDDGVTVSYTGFRDSSGFAHNGAFGGTDYGVAAEDYYVLLGGETGTIVISGLQSSELYDLVLISSANDPGSTGRGGDFTVNGSFGNGSSPANGDDFDAHTDGFDNGTLMTWTGVSPVSGSITIQVSTISGNNSSHLNAFTIEGTFVPEPGSLALLGLGGLLIGARRRRD